MYTLVKAYHLDRLIKNKWVELTDLEGLLNTKVEYVNGTYGRTQLILTHNTEPDKRLLYDFTEKHSEFQGTTGSTLRQWLIDAAGFNLHTTVHNKMTIGKAMYADLIEAKFKIETVIPGGTFNPVLADEVRSDLLITVPSHVSPEVVRDNCLFTVAGYLHRPYATVNGVYLQDGGTTHNRSNMNTAGIISMNTLGGLKTYPITEDMLSALPGREERRRKLRQPVFVKIPNYNPKTQTAFLSLMGVLLPMGKTFYEVGEGLFEINLVQYDYLMQFMRAERILGFKELKKKIEQRKDAPTLLSLFDVAGRDFLLGILTCSQTFIIVVDTPGVYIERKQLETTQNSMSFISPIPVEGPVVDGQGVFLEYLINRDLDAWVIDTPPTDLVNRRVKTGPFELGDSADSLADHQKPLRRNTAYQLIIGKQTFT